MISGFQNFKKLAPEISTRLEKNPPSIAMEWGILIAVYGHLDGKGKDFNDISSFPAK